MHLSSLTGTFTLEPAASAANPTLTRKPTLFHVPHLFIKRQGVMVLGQCFQNMVQN